MRHGLAISLPGAGVGRKLAFPAPPLVEEGSAEGAGRILRRPRRFPGDVGHPAALGVLPAAFDDRLGDRGRNQSLGRSQEPGPEQRPGGAQGQRGRKTPAVGDAAGGQHRHGSGQVGHYRHEGQRGPPPAVPASFGPLRHDDVSACVG